MLNESNKGSRHFHTTLNGALARGTKAFDNIVKKLRTRDTELRRVKKQLETSQRKQRVTNTKKSEALK